MKNAKQWVVILLLLAMCIFSMFFHVLFTRDTKADQKYHMLLTKMIHDECEWIVAQNADDEEALVSSLQKMIRTYEAAYPVRIRLVSREGVPSLDKDNVFEPLPVREPTLTGEDAESAYTKINKDRYLSTQFVDRLDLFVSVESTKVASTLDLRFYIGTFLAFLLIAALSFVILNRMENIRRNTRVLDADTDPETGLYTVRYFNELYGMKGSSNTTRYKSIAVFDIDSFAGSEERQDNTVIVLSIVELAEKLFGERGVLFRFNEDHFVILMEWSAELAYEICREFCQKVEEMGKTTVSVGLTPIQMFDTIRRNYYRAVQYCFLVKEMGGNGVKRG